MFRNLLRNVYLLVILSVVVNAADISTRVCTNPRNESGICVPIKDCDYVNKILEKRSNGTSTPDELQFVKDSFCGTDDTQKNNYNRFLVCCPIEQKFESRNAEASIPAVISPRVCTNPLNESGICVPVKDCDHVNKILEKRSNGTITPGELQFVKDSFCGTDDTQKNNYNRILVCCPIEQKFESINSKASIPAVISTGVCKNPLNESGICVPVKDCDYVTKILKKKAKGTSTPGELQFVTKSVCGTDDTQKSQHSRILVCCAIEQKFESRNSEAKESIPGNILPQPGQCGKVLSDRIVGGNVTKIDEFPWMALVQYQKAGGPISSHCGGTLINSRYVLTAAHCINHPEIRAQNYTLHSIRLGEWDTTENPDFIEDIRGRKEYVDPYIEILIEYAIAHPNYVPLSKEEYHDIGLVRLVESAPTTTYIKPICLPIAPQLRTNFTSLAAEVAGWGVTEQNVESTIKLKALVTVSDVNSCHNTYFNGPSKRPISGDYQLCAGGESGIDSCSGDSGGPLMITQQVDQQDVYFQIGIVSFGPRKCGTEGWPGVYTRVGNYNDWIVNNLMP